MSTLAGTAETGNADGDRATARFSNPVNALVSPDGMVYVADFDNGRIRSVDAAGNVTTLINQVGFSRPFGMAWASPGVMYVQTDNDPQGAHTPTSGTIWRVDVAGRSAVVVATNLGRPRGIAVLADGRIAMADYVHHVIRLLDPGTGHVTGLAGTLDLPGNIDATGVLARFSQPYGIVVRSDGKLVVADLANHRLRLVDVATGATTTLAGAGAGFTDGALTTAEFHQPQGLAITSSGDIYVTDTGNYRIRRVRGASVDTVAGNGTPGYIDADDRLAAELFGLEGMAASRDGAMLYIADGNRGEPVPYNRVRMVNMAQ